MGRPWRANPEPPDSFNCGELVRWVYLHFWGIDSPAIPVKNANDRLDCVRAMQPDLFGLVPLEEDTPTRDLDVLFMGRRERLAHCGLAVWTNDELRVLHCPQSACGVSLDSLFDLQMLGFSHWRWFRHREALA